jgi:segregation and condensation protein B
MSELKNQIEALLFSSGRKMTVEELKTHLSIGADDVIVDALTALQKDYDDQNRAMMVVNEGDLWKLAVREKHMNLARKINPNTELTKSMMETLAVIAWKQPITQSEVISIRTNKAYEHISGMEKMGFLIKEKYGRTFMLKLTQKFFDYFDLRDAQSARDLFKHIKATEQTQQKLEEARLKAGITDEVLQGDGNQGVVGSKDDGAFQEAAEEHKELVVTEDGTSDEDLVSEEDTPEAQQENKEEQHEDAVETGAVDEDIDNSEDRAAMVADDEMENEEAGFVQGYEKDAEETQEHSVIPEESEESTESEETNEDVSSEPVKDTTHNQGEE